MPRDYRVFLEDILQAIGKIRRFTSGMSFQDFVCDEKTIDSVIRNLEVIGEAVKNLPDDLRLKYPSIDWKRMAGLRDILIHEYFGIDLEIIWDVVQNKLLGVEKNISAMLNEC